MNRGSVLYVIALCAILASCARKEPAADEPPVLDLSSMEQEAAQTPDLEETELSEEAPHEDGGSNTHVSFHTQGTMPSLRNITSGPKGRLGVNTTEIDPINYQNPDLEILRQMGAEPYLISYLAGEQFYRQALWDRALAEFNTSINRNANFIEALISRGNTWMKKNDYSRAIDDYTRAIRLDSARAELYNYRGFARAALAAGRRSEINLAIEDYTRAVTINRNYVDALVNRSHALYQTGDYARTIEDCNRIIAMEPSNAVIWNRRGSAWYALENDDRAIADFNEAIRFNAQYAAAFYNRGNAWYNKRDFDKALADLNRCLSINPSHAAAYTSRGNLFALLGNNESASADYASAQRLQR